MNGPMLHNPRDIAILQELSDPRDDIRTELNLMLDNHELDLMSAAREVCPRISELIRAILQELRELSGSIVPSNSGHSARPFGSAS